MDTQFVLNTFDMLWKIYTIINGARESLGEYGMPNKEHLDRYRKHVHPIEHRQRGKDRFES